MEDAVVCMNGMCASLISIQWEKGWPLRSGGFATLCHNCGTAYKNLDYCEMFHSEETGWRECSSCGKRLHCGCIASSPLLELLDTGGVICKGCSKSFKLPSTPSEEQHEENDIGQDLDKMVPAQLGGDDDKKDCEETLPPSRNVNTIQLKLEDDFAGSGEADFKLSCLNQSSIGPSKTEHKSLVKTNLSISLSASSNSNTLAELIAEERELSSPISSFPPGCRPRQLLPRLPNAVLAPGLESNSSTLSPLRVARPPVEGRVKNQLLPRYWPRITDQELQKISGDSNSTVVPLFEKVLSASDAGRIGRLVLPKACAEAYFPPISQPEGLPLRIQDVKGKEWVFQFRFWPNNNSRMYVLEGVTPCIQSMQLQAGDTVTFSRMDPDGKLLMGFRKSSNSISAQKASYCGGFQGEPIIGNAENIPIMSGYSGLLQSLNAGRSSSMTMLSKHHVYTGNMGPHIIENTMSKSGDNPLLLPERKRRNIGAKSKRLLIDGHDSLELKLSWEEVQDMLCPPPSVKPSTISIEDHEFEEFDEPPVFGKSSIFILRQSGELQQWSQCDSCFKWRKIPIDFLLPPKWTCQDNVYNDQRNLCSTPEELSSRELEHLLKMNKEFKRRRFSATIKPGHEHESQDLEALTNAAASGAAGGDMNEPGASSVAATTKHPRHRPGCSCIVCIQPPSGKGKHKPTCMCNVCMTVKRRFKTLMMRKKKRQSEREAEIAQRLQLVAGAKEESEVNSIPSQVSLQFVRSDNTADQSVCQSEENAGINKGRLDLNSCPDGDHTAAHRISMTSLVQQASLPLDIYLRQRGLTSLVAEQQATSSPVAPQAPVEDMAQAQDEPVGFQELEEGSHDLSEKDDRENDTS